jgi:acetyl esterase/lipase
MKGDSMHFSTSLSTSIRRACLAAILLAAGAQAQDTPARTGFDDFARMARANPPRPVAAPAIKAIVLAATGSPDTAIWETMFGQTTVRNVTQPVLYPVLPPEGKANGTALVIAPGGGFLSLSMDSEGLALARLLAARGVSCFVLAYRLDPTPKDPAGFLDAVGRRFASAKKAAINTPLKDDGAQVLAQADGLAAIRYVRAHAADFGIDSKRIGMIGFSAGGRTTMNVVTSYDAPARPDFIGVIYGMPNGRPVPPDAPPAFVALAADDDLAGHAGVPIFEAWRAAGKPVELHVYAGGGHGFGMRTTGTTADHWSEDFIHWMQAGKLLAQ